MAVYRRGYTRYEGELTRQLDRLLVLPRFAGQQILSQRLVTTVLVASMFWPLACAVYVYMANRADLLAGFGGPEVADLMKIDADFFIVFMNTQASFAIVLAALVGPGLIAPDLSNGALPLYFSRPLSRTEYVIARMLVLVGLLSVVTWVPGVMLFIMQWGMAGWGWFGDNWMMGAAIFFGFMIWALLVGLVALASSAYVKWRVVGGALVLAVFFVLAGATELVNAVLRVRWAAVFNPALAMNQIWRSMLGADPLPGPGALASFVGMGLIVVLLLLVLERKLRPVQVVS
jgi:ABC-2 type transport system permease protein